MTKDEAIQLKARVNELLVEAKIHSKYEHFDAVNWGDLSVVDVIKEESLLCDETEYVILVANAAPESNLSDWISDRLNLPNVSVRTEW